MIVWKDGTGGKGVVQAVEKISPREWKLYRKRLIAASPLKGKDKIQARLRETWVKIKKSGGFA